MRVFTGHDRPDSLDPDRDWVVVEEGFSWPAFVLWAIWALWHRMWRAALFMVLAAVALEFALMAAGADGVTRAAAAMAYSALVGCGANDWRRAAVARQGYRQAGTVAASGRDAALHRFFDLAPEAGPENMGAG